ncbi:MAG TPA: hypothetical protein VNF73_09700, partial [Candidatus Saccharimonadales bacterium]|nr:hypothetical protein [Candidatus Saccharimonadales bacterium]
VISEWLGHAGIAITASHYAAVVPTLRHEAAAAMDRALASSPRPMERSLAAETPLWFDSEHGQVDRLRGARR